MHFTLHTPYVLIEYNSKWYAIFWRFQALKIALQLSNDFLCTHLARVTDDMFAETLRDIASGHGSGISS